MTSFTRDINLLDMLGWNKSEQGGPGWVAQLVGVPSSTLKGCGFDPGSGNTPGLQIRSLVGAHTGGNRLMFFSLFL